MAVASAAIGGLAAAIGGPAIAVAGGHEPPHRKDTPSLAT